MAKNPIIIIGGDRNRRDVSAAFSDYANISQKNFDPTRGPACLDIVFSNAADLPSEVWPPLETPEGTLSDRQRSNDAPWITNGTRRLCIKN